MRFSTAYCKLLLTFYCVNCYRAQLVICQVYCSQTIKLSVRSIVEVATDPERTGPGSYCFFADPDPVSLEDADPDLNLALPHK